MKEDKKLIKKNCGFVFLLNVNDDIFDNLNPSLQFKFKEYFLTEINGFLTNFSNILERYNK